MIRRLQGVGEKEKSGQGVNEEAVDFAASHVAVSGLFIITIIIRH